MMTIKNYYFAVSLVFGASSVAVAQPVPGGITELDKVTTTASRVATRVRDLPVPIQVIERAQIERSQASSLLELLRGRAGLDFTNSGGPGNITSLYMRGTAASNVLILVDGVRISSVTTGTAALQDIPLEQIERIEIARGQHSSLYGADAIGGVIQLFTRNAATHKVSSDVQHNASISAGSNQLRQGSTGLSYHSQDNNWMMLQGSWLDTEGINACNGSSALFQGCGVEEPDRDGYRNTALNLRTGYTVPGTLDTLHLESHFLEVRAKNQFDGNTFSGNEADNRQQLYGGKVVWNISDHFDMKLQAARHHDQSDNYYRPAGAINRTPTGRFYSRRDSASAQWDVRVAEPKLDTEISLGADWQRDQLDSDVAYTVKSRENTALYAEMRMIERMHNGRSRIGQLSTRKEKNEQFGDHSTTTASWHEHFEGGLQFNMSYSSGYRVPTFNELYWPGPFGGNPDLKPEESVSLNMGLANYNEQGHIAANLYYTDFSNIIIWDATGPQNVTSSSYIKGIELTGSINIAGFDIHAQVNHVYARQNGLHLPRRASFFGRLDIDKQWRNWGIGLSTHASGSRFDNLANTQRLPGYGIVDIRTEYHFSPNWTIQTKVTNVADRYYETVAWYNQPGREYQLSLRYKS